MNLLGLFFNIPNEGSEGLLGCGIGLPRSERNGYCLGGPSFIVLKASR